MSKVRFELNRAGVRELLQSPEAQNLVMEYAERVQSRAGKDYEASVIVGRLRARASVIATTYEARKDNFENNTLLKALGGGK